MGNKRRREVNQIILSFVGFLLMIGAMMYSNFREVITWETGLFVFFLLLMIPLCFDVVGRFALGEFALEYKPSLIPRFFKEKSKRGKTDITNYYFLGKYYFDKADYQKTEKYLERSIEALFYKETVIEKTKSNNSTGSMEDIAKSMGIKEGIDNFYKNHNDFIAFTKSSWLYLQKSYYFMVAWFDGFYLQGKPLLSYIETKKELYPEDEFLQDFNTEKRTFQDNTEPLFDNNENLNEEQKKAQKREGFRSAFDGSIDLFCLKAKFMVEQDNFIYVEKALENLNKLLEIVEQSSSQILLWRILYVRGLAYHKLGDTDLAYQDWKQGVELGDSTFSKKMCDKNRTEL